MLDTQLLLWAAGEPERLPSAVREMIDDRENQLIFSPVSLWEISIKAGMGRNDVRADSRLLRRGLLDNEYLELPVTGAHVIAMDHLPPLHNDPFDRMLIAQAMSEGAALLTVDPLVAQYHGPVRMI
ncbi:MAG TPA: type II toxin-antitoxin system VapC family toxin [Acidobacteriaceae bacterium]|nr:type II toxin-antitoxin system VapC family toxin [Acidobacteriaceae bacterium]